MNKYSIQFIAAVGCLSFCGANAFAQNTWWVDAGAAAPGSGTPDHPYTSIHYAVHQPEVVSGDLVLVLPGRYEETVEIVDKYITLRSTGGASSTVIDAVGKGTTVTVIGGQAEVLDFPDWVVIEGFTITGGTGTWRDGHLKGGGVLAEGVQLALQRSIVRANRATLGGGIAAESSYLDLYDVELEDNVAETEFGLKNGKGGAIFARMGSVLPSMQEEPLEILGGALDTVGAEVAAMNFAGHLDTREVRLRENAAGIGGGIYAMHASLNLVDTQILANQAWGETFDGLPAQGGGVYAATSEVMIEGGRIGENLAWGPNTLGGGLRFCDETTAEIRAVLIDQNAAGDWRQAERAWTAYGGGIASDAGTVGEDLELRDNHATWGGGGIYGAGEFRDLLVAGNSAHKGGGIYTDYEVVGDEECFAGFLYLEQATIRDNQALALGEQLGEGGGIFGPAFAIDSELSGNVAYGSGGGAHGATLFDSEVAFNRIVPADHYGPAFGAGVYKGHLENVLLHGNTATGFGDIPAYGGGAAEATLVLTQVYDNEAPFGGGAANSFLDRVTVYGNRGSCDCGGLYFSFQGAVGSSIVWNNYPHQIVDLIGVKVDCSTVQHGWPGSTNVGLNPMFWYPDSYDFHLRPGSYCIDHGDPSGLDPDGTRCDMGALCYNAEWCGVPDAYCEATVNSQGCTPQIGFTGSPTLTGPDDFVIHAVDLINQKTGLLFWGYNTDELPFGGSTLCVMAPRIRTPVQTTGGNSGPPDCSGTLSYHLTQEYMNDRFMWHGRSIFAQFIYRDPELADGYATTDALRVIICQ